jgi:hypothetical protein
LKAIKIGIPRAGLLKSLAIFSIIAIIGISFFIKQSQQALVNKVLEKAGKNRIEIEKVIEYFTHDSNPQKLEAAMYLITGLGNKYYYSGNGVSRYRRSFDSIDSLFKSNHGIFNSSWDSIQKLHPPPSLSDLEAINDIDTIKGALLISHINAAFKAWSFPWASTLNFKEFCEYLLPYKLVNEEPDFWMESIQKEYAWLSDSMGNSKDLKRACILVNNSLIRKYNLNGRFSCNWDVNYSDLIKLRQGQCLHLTQLTAYVMRAMGIPVTMNFTPHWANKNSSHGWNGLFYHGKDIVFMGCESNPGKTKLEFTRSELMTRKIAKVYRKMYKDQDDESFKNLLTTSEIDNFFLDRRNADVTQKYIPVSEVNLSIKNPKAFQLVYLCVFNNNEWRPIALTKMGLFSKAAFKDMGRDVVYLPMFSNDGLWEPAGAPFLITKEGGLKSYLTDQTKLISCTLNRKYPEDKSNLIKAGLTYELFYWDDKWIGLEKKIAIGPVLKFNHVPSQGLLLLRCLDKGKQERIFTYEQQKQIWW